MQLLGVEFLAGVVAQGGFSAKMVFNEHGAIFFPVDRQHRDQKTALVSYEDDYAGNALAAMLKPGAIEIRYHRDFGDKRVAQIVGTLLAEPALALLRGWRVTYQGRALRIAVAGGAA